MKKILVFFLLFSVLFAEAQLPVSVDRNESPAIDSAANLYFAARGQASVIYSGRIFYGYPGIIGDAFYPSGGWQKGSLIYDGSRYHNIAMMYDIHKGQVVIRHPNKISICLFSERVQKFYYDGKIFVRLKPDAGNVLNPGFYQQLSEGRITVIVAREKKIEEKIVDLSLERRFISFNTYYALKEGNYYLIKKQKTLIALLKDQKQNILKHLKKEKLKYKHDPEKTITAIAEFYNQL